LQKTSVKLCRNCNLVHWVRVLFCPGLLLSLFQVLNPATTGRASVPLLAVSNGPQTRAGESSPKRNITGTTSCSKDEGGGWEVLLEKLTCRNSVSKRVKPGVTLLG